MESSSELEIRLRQRALWSVFRPRLRLDYTSTTPRKRLSLCFCWPDNTDNTDYAYFFYIALPCRPFCVCILFSQCATR